MPIAIIKILTKRKFFGQSDLLKNGKISSWVVAKPQAPMPSRLAYIVLAKAFGVQKEVFNQLRPHRRIKIGCYLVDDINERQNRQQMPKIEGTLRARFLLCATSPLPFRASFLCLEPVRGFSNRCLWA